MTNEQRLEKIKSFIQEKSTGGCRVIMSKCVKRPLRN